MGELSKNGNKFHREVFPGRALNKENIYLQATATFFLGS
jgi:hypothetical protein